MGWLVLPLLEENSMWFNNLFNFSNSPNLAIYPPGDPCKNRWKTIKVENDRGVEVKPSEMKNLEFVKITYQSWFRVLPPELKYGGEANHMEAQHLEASLVFKRESSFLRRNIWVAQGESPFMSKKVIKELEKNINIWSFTR